MSVIKPVKPRYLIGIPKAKVQHRDCKPFQDEVDTTGSRRRHDSARSDRFSNERGVLRYARELSDIITDSCLEHKDGMLYI